MLDDALILVNQNDLEKAGAMIRSGKARQKAGALD